MYTSFSRACLLFVGFIFTLTVNAAGLGKLTVNSYLGQPFNAEIDLVSVSDEELSSLKAGLASREAFVQAGLSYAAFFSTFKIAVESRIDGTPFVSITSPQSVNEPFLSMLVELNWASGRLLREYTVLLDPADTRLPEPVAPVVQAVPENAESTLEAEPAIVQDVQARVATPGNEETEPSGQVQTVETRQSALPSTQAPGTYGPILQGDTLSSIARQVKPDGVNLDRMLVALFRANREAFIADNMNLLRTGVILKIPDLQQLAEISETEARQEVRVQVSDWHEYRQNLAMSTQEPQDLDSLSQTATGQITTAVEGTAAARSESPEEVLRLSSGESMRDAQGADSDLSALERLRMMEEDAIARNLALQEANERVAMLEKNIENLQKLLALQNSDLAQAQINAEAQRVAETEIESIEVIPSLETIASSETAFDVAEGDAAIELGVLSEHDTAESPITNEAEDIETSPAPPVTSVAAVSNPVLLPEAEAESSWLDQVMGNMTYIGAGFAVLLLTMLAVIYRRRRNAAEAEAEAEESRFEELSSALRDKTAAVVAAAHANEKDHDDQEEFDQENQFFAEDDVQDKDDAAQIDLSSDVAEKTAMGRDESTDADQQIELDFSKENEITESDSVGPSDETESSFDMDALDDNQSTLESFDDLSQDEATKAMDFDAELKGNESAADEQGLDEMIDSLVSPSGTDDPQETVTVVENTDNKDENLIEFPSDESRDLADSKPEQAAEINTDTVSAPVDNVDVDNMLDFSVDSSAIDLSDENYDEGEDTGDKESLVDETNVLDTPELDTLPEITADNENAPVNAAQQGAEIDLSDINLDIENTPEITENTTAEEASGSALSDSDTNNEKWHEIETKIDLAKAYLEMEDMEGAREMLEEVVQEGNEAQQNAAKELLEKL